MAYTVVKGDNLSRIAKANGLTLAQLLELNPQYKDNPDMVQIGASINVSQSTAGSGGGVTPEQVKEWYTSTGADIGWEANGETPDQRAKRIADAINSGERTVEQVQSSIAQSKDRMVAAGSGDTDPAKAATGSTTTTPGIMGGGTLTKITREGQDDLWSMVFNQGGTKHVYLFDSYEAMTAALGNDAITGGKYGFNTITERQFDDGARDGSYFNMGSANPLVGQTGDYAHFYQDIEDDAIISAGSRNPGAIGAYLKDPEIKAILAASLLGNWSIEREQAEIRNTKYYQDVMYPGITNLLDQGVDQPEAKWWQYHDSVSDDLGLLGYQMDDDGTYRSTIGKMMQQGISDTVFKTMAPQYLRAKQSPEFAAALDYWLDKTAGRNVSFDDVFDAMSGQAEGDLLLAVESGIIQFQSTLHNTILSDEQITRIASQTQLSEAEIATSFTTAEENLLALGDRGLSRYGLSESALVSSAFGLTEGEQTAEEVRRLAAKTTRELGLQDDKKAQFYASFNERGALIKPGLQALAPEAG